MASFRSKWMLLAVLVFLVVLLDQASKAWITVSLPENVAIPVVDGFFNIVHVQNPGGAFGFLAEGYSDFKRTFFLAGTVVAAVVLMLVFRKLPTEYVFLRTGIALILGGAAGNFIDRLRQGRVVDFLDFYIGDLHWPAFNVADSAVTAGAVIFLFHLIFKKIPE